MKSTYLCSPVETKALNTYCTELEKKKSEKKRRKNLVKRLKLLPLQPERKKG
jgi:hypothetical protein